MKKVGGFIAGAFAVKGIANFTKTCIESASKVQSAFTGLNSIVQGTGNAFSQAQKFVDDYTKDGLVSIQETATAYKNLLSRGYNTSQIEDVLTRLKDSAAFGRQASYDLGEAVVTATEGLKNENSILVDNAGVTKNVAKMWEEWAKAHNTTTAAMTQAQKIEAEYNGIMKETRFQVGDAAAYTKTFSGQIQQLKFNFNQMTVAIGKVVTPLAQLFIPIINNAINAVTRLFNSIQSILKIFGLEMPSVVSKSSSSIIGIGDSASEAAKEATKAAKTINKAFAPLDEIHVLNTSKSSGSGSGGVNTESSTTSSPTQETTSKVEETNSAFSKLINYVKELQSLFMDGFNSTFNIDFDGLKKRFKEIKNSLKNIFTDKKVLNASETWAKSITFNLGKITGSVGSIGGNIAEGLVSSISLYLSQNSGRISDYIVKSFDISSRKGEITGNLFETLGSISEVFKSDVATQIGANIISMFTNPFMSLDTIFQQFTIDMYDLLVTPIVDNTDKIKLAIEGTLTAIEPMTNTLSEMFTTLGDLTTKVYDEHLKPFFDDVKIGLSDTFGKFLDVYNTYFVPFFERVSTKVSEIWDNHLKPLWENVSEFIGSIIDLIKVIWNNYLKPVVDWIIQNVVPKIVPVIENIWNKFSSFYTIVCDIINGIVTSLKGIIQFITGIFSKDWDKAWTGIKNIFKGIADSLISVFKVPLNLIIDGINKFIDGVNKIKLPDWDILGKYAGKGFNIKKIQKLEQGGWVAPNSPQLAIVGDNKREGEIITPESKIYGQVVKAIKDTGGTNSKQEITMTLNVNYEDGRKMIKKINQAEIDAGEILLLV